MRDAWFAPGSARRVLVGGGEQALGISFKLVSLVWSPELFWRANRLSIDRLLGRSIVFKDSIYVVVFSSIN
jgi:hypothetical protein